MPGRRGFSVPVSLSSLSSDAPPNQAPSVPNSLSSRSDDDHEPRITNHEQTRRDTRRNKTPSMVP